MVGTVIQIKKSRIMTYGFKIVFDDPSKANEIIPMLLSWVNVNLSPYDPEVYKVRLYGSWMVIYFSDKDHAMRFKLTWVT